MKRIMAYKRFDSLKSSVPWWYSISARALPCGILFQFLTAGLSLFRDDSLWALHEVSGLILVVFPGILLGGSLLVSRLGRFGWWAGLTGLLYLFQIALSAGAEPELIAYHPFNGALLLTASLILLMKVERRLGKAASGQSIKDPV